MIRHFFVERGKFFQHIGGRVDGGREMYVLWVLGGEIFFLESGEWRAGWRVKSGEWRVERRMGGVCGNCGTGVVGVWLRRIRKVWGAVMLAGRIARKGALQSGPYG